MGVTGGFGIGFKLLSHEEIIVSGETYQVKEHERTALIEDEVRLIFDHPTSFMRPFAPTADKWVEIDVEL